MEFEVKKTTELSDLDLKQIKELFERVFEKERDIEYHLRQYKNNPLGYSFHSLIKDNGIVVGQNSYIPSYYFVDGKRYVFVNSIDTMIDKKYRDFFSYYDMVTKAYEVMKANGVAFLYGYPNEMSYPLGKKSKLAKDIGKMHTYCLPIHIGGIKKSLRFLNQISEGGSRLFISIAGLFASSKKDTYLIEKDAATYNETRYKRADGEYNKVTADGFDFYYKIKEHEGVRTAFLIDVTEKSPKAFNKAVKHIVKNHSKEFDILLYPGYLKFKNTSMIKLPRKFEPKNFYFTGKALDKNLPEEIWNISNWDTNLSNYDLI